MRTAWLAVLICAAAPSGALAAPIEVTPGLWEFTDVLQNFEISADGKKVVENGGSGPNVQNVCETGHTLDMGFLYPGLKIPSVAAWSRLCLRGSALRSLPVSNPMHLALSGAALATLFFAGVAMNNLYLAFRHIGFSWALHAGWNVVWLSAAIYDAATNAPLREPQIFDRVLGSPAIVVAACAIALLSFVLLTRRGGWTANAMGQSPE